MSDHIWTQATTDITIRWKKIYGYVPASEQEFYKKKWADWKELLSRGIEDLEPIKKPSRPINLIDMRKQK